MNEKFTMENAVVELKCSICGKEKTGLTRDCGCIRHAVWLNVIKYQGDWGHVEYRLHDHRIKPGPIDGIDSIRCVASIRLGVIKEGQFDE